MIKRNDPCPCGSGKKYKKCCMVDFAKGPKRVTVTAAPVHVPVSKRRSLDLSANRVNVATAMAIEQIKRRGGLLQ